MTSFYMFRLVPPRPTFAADQTEHEAAVMAEHVRYWTGLLGQGKAVVFGPVLDPAGVWGLGVIEVEDDEEARRLVEGDPVTVNGVGRIEILPMLQAVARPH